MTKLHCDWCKKEFCYPYGGEINQEGNTIAPRAFILCNQCNRRIYDLLTVLFKNYEIIPEKTTKMDSE